ncbi:MAG: bacterial transcriptional activator domain-containing protein [bacterium]
MEDARIGHAARRRFRRAGALAAAVFGVLCSLAAGPVDEWIVPSAGSQAASDICPAVKVRVCVLPIFLRTSEEVPEDLAPLLAACLRRDPHLEVSSTGTRLEGSYEAAPWGWKADWADNKGTGQGQVYFDLREKWLLRARAASPADLYVWGKVLSTGSMRSIAVEVLDAASPPGVMFTDAQEAASEEEIPQTLRRIADEIGARVETEWLVRCAQEARGQYLARLVSLETAVGSLRKLLDSRPDLLPVRALLLGLCAESPDVYVGELQTEAAELVRLFDVRDRRTSGLLAQLDLDPFDLLCRAQAARNDWAAVLDTCRLGLEKYPLRERVYRTWQVRAYAGLGRPEEALREAGRLLESDPEDRELVRLRREIESTLRLQQSP